MLLALSILHRLQILSTVDDCSTAYGRGAEKPASEGIYHLYVLPLCGKGRYVFNFGIYKYRINY